MRVFESLGRRWRGINEDTQLGISVFLAFVLIVGTITFVVFAGIKLNTTASSAVSSSKATNTLLTNGKTASAISAKQAAKAAKEGEAIIAHVESQLDEILSHSDANRSLICSIVQSVHVTSPTIQADCKG